MNGKTPTERRIVVGVDGSQMSMQALRWAIDQAKLVDAAVEAVIAWVYPTMLGWATGKTDVQLDRVAGQKLAEAVREVAGAEPTVEIRQRALPGHAAQVLLDRARGADLLVVGSRGYGGFEGALLGSVSQHCVQHATCPVVVIRTASGDTPA